LVERADSAEAAFIASTDTFYIRQTEYEVIREVSTDTVLVRAADAALGACTSSLLACESALAAKDSLSGNQASQIRNLEAQVATTRALADARCSGTVPTWAAITGIVIGAGAGAWIRGN
jgi:hypothetical protein